MTSGLPILNVVASGVVATCIGLLPSALATSPAEPPSIGSPSYADWRIEELDAWSNELPLPDISDADARLVHETMQTLTLIATSLLVQGERGGAASSPAMVAGATLADGLGAIHEVLLRMSAGRVPIADLEAARELLAAFEREARLRLGMLAVPNPELLDENLVAIFTPLQQAMRRLDSGPCPSGWWEQEQATQGPLGFEDVSRELEELAAAADWLGERDRQSLSDRLEEASNSLPPPDDLEAFELDRRRRAGALLRVARAIDAVRGTRKGRTDAASLGKVFMVMLASSEGPLPPVESTVEIARIIERMDAYRRHEMGDLPMSLRTLHVRLGELYRRSERNLLDHIDALLASDSPRSDPAIVSSIMEQAEHLEALQQVSLVPVWIEVGAAIDPPSREPLERQLKKMNRLLLDLDERPDARRAMRALDWQTRVFVELPLEDRLRQADPELDRLMAGLGPELVDGIASARVQWIQDWAAGDANGEGAMELWRHLRLLRSIEATEQLLGTTLPGDGLNDWSGWHVPSGVMDTWLRRLNTRQRVAATALVHEEASEADSQLDRMETDLSILRLVTFLLAEQPTVPAASDAARIVGQLAHPPRESAWMLEHREELADTCRYVLEMVAARRDGRADEADAIEAWIAISTMALLQQLDESDPTFPDLPGFDGSDPDPDLPPMRLEHDRRR